MKLKNTPYICIFIFINILSVYSYSQNSEIYEVKEKFKSQALMLRALEILDMSKFDYSLRMFNESISRNPYNHFSRLCIKILSDAEKGNISFKNSKKILESIKLIKYHDFRKALNRIDDMGGNVDYFPRYVIKGLIYQYLKDYKKAEKYYSNAVYLDEEKLVSLIFRAHLYFKMSLHNKALDDLNLIIKNFPDFAAAYFEIGENYSKKKQYDLAIINIKIAAKLWADYDVGLVYEYFHRGIDFLKNGEYKKAIFDLGLVIKKNERIYEAYINRGIAYRHLKQYEKALADFNFVIKSDPKYMEAYYNRAMLYYNLKEYENGINDLNEALFLEGDEKLIYLKLAESNFKLKKYHKANSYFTKTLELNPQCYIAYYWKGLAYDYSEDYSNARKFYKRFINSPTFKFQKHKEFVKKRLKEIN